MPIESFRDLKVWRAGVQLAVCVVRLTSGLPPEERFGYAPQLRRSAGSIAANIAEGYGRHTRREYLRYLAIASGSLCELETHLEVVRQVGWCDPAQLEEADRLCGHVRRMLAGLRRALRPTGP